MSVGGGMGLGGDGPGGGAAPPAGPPRPLAPAAAPSVSAARQLALALEPAASVSRDDLIEDASNAAALAWLDRDPAEWPQRRLAIWGPAGVGKTHMLRAAAAGRGWRVIGGPDLRGTAFALAPAAGTAVDDADCAAEEEALLHLINASAERGAPLLLAGREPPARWRVALPDLASRLRATHAVAIGAPSDALLAALLAKLFADRQLRVDPAVQAWLLARLPREAAALAEAAARLDRAALAVGGAVTRPLARAALAGFGEEDGPGSGSLYDDTMSEGPDASTAPARLL